MRIIKKDEKEVSKEIPDYNDLDMPINQRPKAVGDGVEDQESMLNVPAFLRRQAD